MIGGMLSSFFVDFTEHIGVNVQPDIRYVVEMFARHEPDDFTDLTFGIEASYLRNNSRLDPLL
jgi:hypothetical protein